MRSRRRWGRLFLIAGGFAILALIAFIVVAPALLRPGANRLRIVQTPRDYGVTFETVEFRPPDQPITLRAWWRGGCRASRPRRRSSSSTGVETITDLYRTQMASSWRMISSATATR